MRRSRYQSMKAVNPTVNLAIGATSVLVGFVANPWFVGTVVTSDGGIHDPLAFWCLALAAIVAVLIGLFLLARRSQIRIIDYFFSLTIATLLFLFSVSLDGALGFLGFPTDNYHKYTNPPGAEIRARSHGEFDTRLRYSAQGFRDRDVPLEKDDPSEKRILVVGDSFAEGYGVEQEEAFPALLTERFDGAHFINAAKSGGHIETYMNILLKRGIQYDLDAVLICVFANDIWQTRSNEDYQPSLPPAYYGAHRLLYRLYPRMYTQFAILRHKGALTRASEAGAEGIVAKVERRIGEERFQAWRETVPDDLFQDALGQDRSEAAMSVLTMGLFDPEYYTATFRLDTPEIRASWKNATAMLSFMVEESRRRQIRVGVVYIPDPVQYDPRFFTNRSPIFASTVDLDRSWLVSDTPLQADLRRWADEADVPFFDLTGALRAALATSGGPLNYLKDTHLNPSGNRVAADALSDWIRQTSFLDVAGP